MNANTQKQIGFIREMKIQTTMKYHCTPIKWLIAKQKTSTGEDGDTLELLCIAGMNIK